MKSGLKSVEARIETDMVAVIVPFTTLCGGRSSIWKLRLSLMVSLLDKGWTRRQRKADRDLGYCSDGAVIVTNS
jgi:hypothetical protein